MWTLLLVLFLILMLQELLQFLGDLLTLGLVLVFFLLLRTELGDYWWRFGFSVVMFSILFLLL